MGGTDTEIEGSLASRRRNSSTSEFASLFFPVFFNSYGDCNQEDFPLSDDVYSLRATGAQEMHETLICELTFRAPLDTGICLTFKNFRIDDCGVSLRIYQEPTAAGKQWVSFKRTRTYTPTQTHSQTPTASDDHMITCSHKSIS